MSNLCWSCQERSVTNLCRHARTTSIFKLPVILIVEALLVVGPIMKVQEKTCQVIALEEATLQEDFDSVPSFVKSWLA